MATIGRTRSSSRTASSATLVSTSTTRNTRSQAGNLVSTGVPHPSLISNTGTRRATGARRAQPLNPAGHSSSTPKLSTRGARARAQTWKSTERFEAVIIKVTTREAQESQPPVNDAHSRYKGTITDGNAGAALHGGHITATRESDRLLELTEMETSESVVSTGGIALESSHDVNGHLSPSRPPEIIFDMTNVEEEEKEFINEDSSTSEISPSLMETENGLHSDSIQSLPPFHTNQGISKGRPPSSSQPTPESITTDDVAESGLELDPTLDISGSRSRQPSLQPFLSYEELELENQVQDRDFYEQLHENSSTFSPSSVLSGTSSRSKTDRRSNGQPLFDYNSWRRVDHRQYYLDDMEHVREDGDPNQRHGNMNNIHDENGAFDMVADSGMNGGEAFDVGAVDEEDDPFGFSKVNRRQQWGMRHGRKPQLVAVNQTQRQYLGSPNMDQQQRAQSQSQSQSQTQQPKHSSLRMQRSPRTDSGTESESTLSSPQDAIAAVKAKMAERRRGNVKDKGKSVLRGFETPPRIPAVVSTPPLALLSNNQNRTDVVMEDDPDLARALQLSLETAETRGPFTLEDIQGDASSSQPLRAMSVDHLRVASAMDFSARESSKEASPILGGSEEAIGKLAMRSLRRLSRLYEDWDKKERDSISLPLKDPSMSEEAMESTMNSTAKTQGRGESLGSQKLDSKPKGGYEFGRASKRSFSESDVSDVDNDDDDDGRPPIVFMQSPVKNPEAGVPLSMEFPQPTGNWSYLPGQKVATTPKTTRPSKKRRLRTEDLEALLPKGRRNITGLSRGQQQQQQSLRKSKRVKKQQAQEVFRDSSNDKVYEIEDEGEDVDEEKDEEPLIRRRRPTATASTETITAGTVKSAGANVNKIPKTTVTSATAATKQLSTKTQGPAKEPKGKEPKGKEPKGKEPKGKEPERDNNAGAEWTSDQWGAHQKCLDYFREVDDFELDVETAR